jgi:hypothetical protein
MRVSASLTPGLGPDVRTSDITQPTERVDESDGFRSLRGRTGERGAEDCAIRNLREHHFEQSIESLGADTTYNETYRAVMFTVEDAITNPTSPTHK